MEKNTATANPSAPPVPGPDDPRFAFAQIVDIVGDLIESTDPADIGNATPCPEFTVKELLEHMVMVMRRVEVIGAGGHWSAVSQEPTDGGWALDYRAAAHDVMRAWADPAILGRLLEVPWGEAPGAALMYTYAAELSVHGWDLAKATNRDFAIDDAVLGGPLVAAKFIPAEGRESPEMPFSPVVDPGADAPVLLQLAGWMGRQVLN